ncbi:hypothetical protein BD410DRAFT_783467 [Rickenella mellea]|uniref:Uncharacterized protein n=1 Tax=Rickenella mellea TaxID=50990 RepID=A0A4Y7QH37_9AGAM|nr:hypothetical protein BD410DRAFT_783467 [Rickenella mellea]
MAPPRENPDPPLAAGAPGGGSTSFENSYLFSLLQSDFSSTSRLVSWTTTADAPNPAITMATGSLISSPLVNGQAAHIRQFCRNGILDTRDFSIDNSSWSRFITKNILEKVADDLRLNLPISLLRVDLLHASLELPDQENQLTSWSRRASTSVRLSVVLPSRHLGGHISLSRAGADKRVVDTSNMPLHEFGILAWREELQPTVQPIISGARFILHYGITPVSPSRRIGSPSRREPVAVEKLRKLFIEWNGHPKPGHSFRAHLLNHFYQGDRLRLDRLVNSDACLLRYLVQLCHELGFKLFLVNIELSVFGQSHSAENVSSCNPQQSDETNETSVDVTQMEDLMGDTPGIFSLLDIDLDDLVCDDDREHGEDDEESERFRQSFFQRGESPEFEVDNSSLVPFVTRTYKRSAVVFWPPSQHSRVLLKTQHGMTLLERVQECKEIPTAHELAAWEAIYDCLEHGADWCYTVFVRTQPAGSPTPMQILASAAARWGNYEMWTRIVRSKRVALSAAVLQPDEVANAVATFGFTQTRPLVDEMLMRTPRQQSLDLVSKIARRLNGEQKLWADQRMAWLLSNLKPVPKNGGRS